VYTVTLPPTFLHITWEAIITPQGKAAGHPCNINRSRKGGRSCQRLKFIEIKNKQTGNKERDPMGVVVKGVKQTVRAWNSPVQKVFTGIMLVPGVIIRKNMKEIVGVKVVT